MAAGQTGGHRGSHEAAAWLCPLWLCPSWPCSVRVAVRRVAVPRAPGTDGDGRAEHRPDKVGGQVADGVVVAHADLRGDVRVARHSPSSHSTPSVTVTQTSSTAGSTTPARPPRPPDPADGAGAPPAGVPRDAGSSVSSSSARNSSAASKATTRLASACITASSQDTRW